MSTKSKSKEIVVAGDIALDWNLVNLSDKGVELRLEWYAALPNFLELRWVAAAD